MTNKNCCSPPEILDGEQQDKFALWNYVPFLLIERGFQLLLPIVRFMILHFCLEFTSGYFWNHIFTAIRANIKANPLFKISCGIWVAILAPK